jgi:hypothetical protein|tara:strand:+ start:651 stop:1055 length:405 start_codon:yes stop_codon:yes gene_type:complete
MAALSPFDYLNSINATKTDIMVDDIAEKAYTPFMVNRGLSYFEDSIIFANEMNKSYNLDNRLQYDFYINTLRKRKRFSKWFKAEESIDVDVIKTYYGYSTEKARQVLKILSNEQVNELSKKVSKGGTGKRKRSN